MDVKLRGAVVAFLRSQLPEEARQTYRRMIAENPGGWMNDPHFQGGVIVRHFLRGNGLTESALGVPSLEPLWPGLLEDAVVGDALIEHGGEPSPPAKAS